MDLNRMKQLAGLNEAKETDMEPLEKSDAGKKSAVEAIKKGIPPGTEHEKEDFDVVLDDRGNVKVSNEKVITKTGGEPAKVTQPGKLKLKEAFDSLMGQRMSPGAQERATFGQEMDTMKDFTTMDFKEWKARCKTFPGVRFEGDADEAQAYLGDTLIGEWDVDNGGGVRTAEATHGF